MGKCNQVKCENPGAFSFEWPGKEDETEICWEHVPKLAFVASSLGLTLRLRPIESPGFGVVVIVPGASR